MTPLVVWHVLASSLALGQVTATFRDGQSPTPAYAGTRDATIHDGTETPWQPGANYDGLDDFLGGAPDSAAALLKFDLSSVPPSTTITSATLRVRVSTDAPGQTVPVYQCLQPWTSAGANWDRYDGVTLWAGPGATGATDHGAQVLGTLDVGSGGTTPVPLGDAGVALVQGWIAGSTPNNGFLLQNYAAAGTAVVDQLNSGSAANWPQLWLGLPDGGTQVIDAGVDTTITSARDPQTVNDNTEHLNADGRPKAAAFLAFDLTSVPPWSTVTSATLLLDCPSDGTALPYSVYASSRPWVENQACWNTYANGQPWGAPGADGPGDHGATALGVLTGVGAPIPVALNAPGTQLVQDWIRGLAPNNGFEIVDYGGGSDGILCHAREETTISERPALQIVYLEGQLGFPGAASAGGRGAPLGPYTLERRRLDGVAIASGAPALAVNVSSSSAGGGFAGDAGATIWPATMSVSIPAGGSASGPFYMRDLFAGRPAILISAGVPWQPAQQVQSVRTVRATVPIGAATPVGGETSLSFQAIDSADVTTAVNLSARLLRTDGGVASSASFTATTIGSPGGTSVSGVAPAGAAAFSVTDSVAERLQVCASITGAPLSEGCVSLPFSAPDHLAISLVGPGLTLPLEGCATETFKMQMEDDAGNALASPSQASFCPPTDAGLVVGPSTLGSETRIAPCVTGTLGPDGSATITLTPTFPVGFTVRASSPDVAGSILYGVAWISGPPSPLTSDLSWLDGADPKQMQVKQGTQVFRLVPRDSCNFSALSRSSEIRLALPDELLVGSGIRDFDAGTLDTPVRLDACPPAAADIFIQAFASNQPLVDQAGNERKLTIVPHCDPYDVGVGCGGCASGPNAGQGAAALALAAVILRVARRRRTAAAPARRAAAGP